MKLSRSLLLPADLNAPRHRRQGLIALGNLVMMLLILTTTAYSAAPPQQQGPSSILPWEYYTVDSPGFFYRMTDRSLRFKADGTACVAYGGDHLYYSCYNKTENTWKTKVVDNSVMVGSYAALAFAKDGLGSRNRPFITYYDALNGALKMAYNLSNDEFANPWTIMILDDYPPPLALETSQSDMIQEQPAVEDPAAELYDYLGKRTWRDELLTKMEPSAAYWGPELGGAGLHTSIAIDALNQVHVSYYDAVEDALKYLFWNGVGAPQIEIVDDYGDQGDAGLWTSLAVDSKNRPQIAYMSEKYDDLKFVIKKGDSWDMWTVDGSHNVGPFPSLAIGANDYPHISYMDFSTNDLKYAALQNDNHTWAITIVDSSGEVGLYTSMVMGGSGNFYISYYNRTNGNLKLAIGSGSNWTTRTVYDAGDVGYFTSIAISPAGYLGISFYNATAEAMQYIYSSGTQWYLASVIGYASDVGLSTSLAISDTGNPFISYMDDTRNLLKYAAAVGDMWSLYFLPTTKHAGVYSSVELRDGGKPVIAYYNMDSGDLVYAEWTLLGWKFTNVDTTRDVGQHVSLALDPAGYPHMSYFDATRGDLVYAYWNPVASRFYTETLDSEGDVGLFTSLAFDMDGRPAISYYDATNEQLKFKFKSVINSWVTQIVDSGIRLDPTNPLHDVGYYSSLAFDGTNPPKWFPHIVYYDDTDLDLLSVSAHWDTINFTWVWDTPVSVDGGGLAGVNVGKWSSMAIDQTNNKRHVCYYDETNGNLKYALWDGAWTLIDVVDTIGNVGMYCSIDLNAAGQPGISYYDASMGDLKFTSLFTLPPPFKHYIPVVRKRTTP